MNVTTNHRRLALFATLLCCGAMSSATASDLRYTFVEGTFSTIDGDNGVDGKAIAATGWYRLQESVFAVLGAQQADFDGNRDALGLAAGLGYIVPLSDQVDGIGIATVRRSSVEGPGVDRSETGYGIQLGARALVTPNIQLRGMLNYVDVFDGDTSFIAQGEYYFNDNLGASLAAQLGGDADSFSIGVNYYFGD